MDFANSVKRCSRMRVIFTARARSSHFTVVRFHRVHNSVRLSRMRKQRRPRLCVRQVRIGQSLADVVEKPHALCNRGVAVQFRRDKRAEFCGFDGMRKGILVERKVEREPAQSRQNVGVHTRQAEVFGGFRADVVDVLLHVFLCRLRRMLD